MRVGWIVQVLFAAANLALVVGVVVLKEKVAPAAQEDMGLLFLVVGTGMASVCVALFSIVMMFFANFRTSQFVALAARPFALLCYVNIAAPIILFFGFPR
jgi:hypothetical protein